MSRNIIDNISNYISKKLSLTDVSNENYDYYKLSITALLSFTLYSVIAIIISLFFGYFPQILLIIPVLLMLRSPSGGSHAQSSFWCLITTTLMYFVIGISTLLLFDYYQYIFILSTLLSFTGLSDIPKYTATHPKHKREKQLKFKKKYIKRLIAVTLINLIFINCIYYNFLNLDVIKISISLSMCMLINRFSLTNFSFYLLNKLK